MIVPILKLDSAEHYRPQPVETVESIGKIAGGPINLAQLPAIGGRMVLPTNPPDPQDTPVVFYHRVVPQYGLWWHQFWLWYLSNPWGIIGFGEHEGDWEFVQFGCLDPDGKIPLLLTASQHQTGQAKYIWKDVELQNGRPVVYVARGTHANYWHPGQHEEDVADGQGRTLDSAEVRDFGSWATWPGQWGNSTGVGTSPVSPGAQHSRWDTPAGFHGRAQL